MIVQEINEYIQSIDPSFEFIQKSPESLYFKFITSVAGDIVTIDGEIEAPEGDLVAVKKYLLKQCAAIYGLILKSLFQEKHRLATPFMELATSKANRLMTERKNLDEH